MDAMSERVGTFYFLMPQIDPVNKRGPVALRGVSLCISEPRIWEFLSGGTRKHFCFAKEFRDFEQPLAEKGHEVVFRGSANAGTQISAWDSYAGFWRLVT